MRGSTAQLEYLYLAKRAQSGKPPLEIYALSRPLRTPYSASRLYNASRVPMDDNKAQICRPKRAAKK
jgi:hypothetical protein